MKNNFFINKKPLIYSLFLIAVFICSLILSSSFSLNFAISLTEKIIHRTLRDHTKWINILKGVVHIPLLVSILLFIIQYTIAGNNIAKKNIELWEKFLSEINQKKYLYFFIIITTFFLFAFYKILDADILYADDISRSHDGDRNWISFGRYVSEFLSILIHCTIQLTDIAPLTQFIAILFMSCTIIILLYILSDNGSINFIYAIPLCYTFLSPYFQQCFCYRFDSPYMTLAVLLPVIPFIFKDDLKSYSFMSFVMLILCCMSYQAGQSIYIMLVIFLSFHKLINGDDFKTIFYFIIYSILSYAAALIIYELLFAANTNRTDTDYYYSTKLSVSSLITNLKLYFTDLSHSAGGLLTRTCLYISVIISLIGTTLKSKINKFVTATAYIFILIFALSLSIGPYILFEQTLLSGRVYLGFNVLTALILFSAFKTSFELFINQKIKFLVLIPVILCIYSTVSFLYTFGNCLKEQKEYNNFRYTLLLNDLSTLVDSEKNIYISFGGSIGYCNAFELAEKKYSLDTIPLSPNEHSIWNIDYCYRFNFMFKDEFFDHKPDWPLLESNYYHNIYGQDNHFYIELKNHKSL